MLRFKFILKRDSIIDIILAELFFIFVTSATAIAVVKNRKTAVVEKVINRRHNRNRGCENLTTRSISNVYVHGLFIIFS